MKNREVARVFNEMADLLEIKGENPFRIRAYRRAAQNIEAMPRDVADLGAKELKQIPGIGADLAEKIAEAVSTGTIKAYEELRDEFPQGLTELLGVPGLGPKTVKLIFEKLDVRDVVELEKLARGHKLSGLPGIKEKTEKNILKGIETLKRGRERLPIGRVLPVARDIVERLTEKTKVKELYLAGSLRRWKDTIKDIDILATSADPAKVMSAFVGLPGVREVIAHGKTKSSVVVEEGVQVDLRVVDEDSLGAALAYFTGSKAHNIRLRDMAVKAGLKVNEYGVFRGKDDRKIGGRKEEDIYKALGLPFIPPELREDRGEIEAALGPGLPNLVSLSDIKGDLHVHSNWSDGSHTIEKLAEIAMDMGYQYIAITDHSKGLGIAGGLGEDRIVEQAAEIDALNKKLKGFRIFKGVEVDIKSDFSLDLPDELLKKLDIVVASVHSGFRQSSDKLTKRFLAAINNPHVTIIAHPTGRLIGERDAYDADMERVFAGAAATGTALEINAYPLRLDLNDVYARRAKELGVRMAISTDTHVDVQFGFMEYGVETARRGWVERSDVLNTLPLKAIQAELVRKRRTSSTTPRS